MLADRPPLAYKKVRYYGEPIAIVIADEVHQAKRAANLIHIDYDPLQVILSPKKAFEKDAPLIHEHLSKYTVMVKGVHAVPKTNIANWTKIRKGNIAEGRMKGDITVRAEYAFGPSDHVALETRISTCQINKNGNVTIHSSTQGPFYVRKMISDFFNIDAGKIRVHTPFVGGAFGGKGCVQLEFLAYIASQAVGGQKIIIQNSREEDMITSPVHLGLEATIELTGNKSGS